MARIPTFKILFTIYEIDFNPIKVLTRYAAAINKIPLTSCPARVSFINFIKSEYHMKCSKNLQLSTAKHSIPYLFHFLLRT